MKKGTFLIFVGYVWAKLLLKLAIYPYESVRDVTRRSVLLPVVFSPLIGLVILFVVGRIGSFLFTPLGIKRDLIAFILSIGTISVLLWQALLLYLLASFFFALKK